MCVHAIDAIASNEELNATPPALEDNTSVASSSTATTPDTNGKRVAAAATSGRGKAFRTK